MIESPVLQELLADCRRKAALETARKCIATVLTIRFGLAADALEAELRTVDENRLDDLVKFAVTCTDFQSFRERLSR
jgi:hypothetical protein